MGTTTEACFKLFINDKHVFASLALSKESVNVEPDRIISNPVSPLRAIVQLGDGWSQPQVMTSMGISQFPGTDSQLRMKTTDASMRRMSCQLSILSGSPSSFCSVVRIVPRFPISSAFSNLMSNGLGTEDTSILKVVRSTQVALQVTP